MCIFNEEFMGTGLTSERSVSTEGFFDAELY